MQTCLFVVTSLEPLWQRTAHTANIIAVGVRGAAQSHLAGRLTCFSRFRHCGEFKHFLAGASEHFVDFACIRLDSKLHADGFCDDEIIVV